MTSSNPAKESLRKEQEAQRNRGKDAELTEALEDTFPASDPVAMQTPITPGEPEKGDAPKDRR